MATPLELSTRPGADGIPVVTVAGEIDMSNADRFRDALGLAAAAADGGSFVVDLTGVEYLDSAGVHALFAHACADPAHRRPAAGAGADHLRPVRHHLGE